MRSSLPRLSGEARVQPGAPPPDQGPRVCPSCLPQLARHTGARLLTGSGTVQDQRAVTVEAELPRGSHGVVRWQSNRAPRDALVLLPRALGTRVDELEALATIEAGAELIDGDRRGIGNEE